MFTMYGLDFAFPECWCIVHVDNLHYILIINNPAYNFTEKERRIMQLHPELKTMSDWLQSHWGLVNQKVLKTHDVKNHA